MNPIPGGRLHRTPTGLDLTLRRRFHAPIADVWRSLTHPESTARWYGAWEGEGGAGSTVRVQMAFEEGKPWYNATIDACEPPHRLAMTSHDYGTWILEVTLREEDGVTELVFVNHQLDPAMVPDVGPGWEYYLDNFVAARAGAPLPAFADYYPSQKAFYAEALRALESGGEPG